MAASDPSAFLVCYQRRPAARVRLICFAHAGGSASSFATWHRLLPPEIEVCSVQLAGRETRRSEPFAREMTPLLEQLGSALAGAHERPVALLGYSLGAVIAFEYARTLRRRGLAGPVQLLVAASRSPQDRSYEPISHLPRPEFLRAITQRYDGIPKPILDDPELLEYFLPVLQADLRLLESYQYYAEPPLSCPITAFGGREDPRVQRDQLDAWAVQTSAGFRSRLFPGGHFFAGTQREAFLDAIREALAGELS